MDEDGSVWIRDRSRGERFAYPSLAHAEEDVPRLAQLVGDEETIREHLTHMHEVALARRLKVAPAPPAPREAAAAPASPGAALLRPAEAEHARQAPAPAAVEMPPALHDLARDARRWAEDDAALARAAAAKERQRALGQAYTDVTAHRRHLVVVHMKVEDAIRKLYRDPDAARDQLAARGSEIGGEALLREIREHSERFGAARRAESHRPYLAEDLARATEEYMRAARRTSTLLETAYAALAPQVPADTSIEETVSAVRKALVTPGEGPPPADPAEVQQRGAVLRARIAGLSDVHAQILYTHVPRARDLAPLAPNRARTPSQGIER